MPGFFIHNGKLLPEGATPISPANRSFRYGDGLFETIRMSNGKIPLWDLHRRRLFEGLKTLRFDIPRLFTPSGLQEDIEKLCRKNGLTKARIRLSVFRSDGGLYDPENLHPNYIIESWPLTDAIPEFNINGLQIGIYEGGRKSADAFASLKSNNFLLYAMAALHAKEQHWNDAIVLNTEERIADSTIANVFWTKGDEVFTCPLAEGPINGVMRKWILQHTRVTEIPITVEGLLQADEVFLTNAIKGIQWVAGIGEKQGMPNRISGRLYHEIILPLFSGG